MMDFVNWAMSILPEGQIEYKRYSRRFSRQRGRRPSTLRDIQEITAKDVFDHAKAGDVIALEIVDFVGAVLGGACAMMSCVVDPEIFVIGGGVSKAGDILLNTVRKYFRSGAFHASEDARFALATLGNDAGMYGSVKMILDTAE
ncbi:MAG: ROK family protein [Lachnospiraceae bacterium]|nr:ROK family protein [Lachnospiraceae bacterium]